MKSQRLIVLVALIAALAVGLALSPAPAMATAIGNHDVTYVGYLNNYPSAGQSTWFYTVTSGSGPAISHITFSLSACLAYVGAGAWTGDPTAQPPTVSLNAGGGNPVFGTDPTTGVTGVKFDQGFNGGETRNYYFTVDGAVIEGSILVAAKAGSGFATGYVTGPACDVLSVTLAAFEATLQGDHILVSWETVSEADNQGFNLYRSTSADELGQLVASVPSQAPGSTAGAAYQWQDGNITFGATYFYTLQSISLSGAPSLHGPVSVTTPAPTAVTLSELTAGAGTVAGQMWLGGLAGLALALVAGLILARRRADGRVV